MRDAFVAELTRLAEADPSVLLLTGDLGFGVLADFAQRFPGQYLNAGVAEQNMAGLAAGLSLEGRRVFTYSIANFPTLRCLEQIRNDICYHDLPVTVVSVGGGFAYGPLGFSHHATEDVAIMGALPGLRVMAPNDPEEARACTALAGTLPGPSYLRLGRNGEKSLHGPRKVTIREGRMIHVTGGKDAAVAILGGCGALDVAIEAHGQLHEAGLDASVWSSPFIDPFDRETVARLACKARWIVTTEEHAAIGGLGTRCAHVIASLPEARARHIGIGLPRATHKHVGDQRFMRAQAGLTAEHVVKAVRARCEIGS
ncbi:MAG: transketolase [Planctomycetes bacterium]|nr:transketolase [Planctomycetota bacterium]